MNAASLVLPAALAGLSAFELAPDDDTLVRGDEVTCGAPEAGDDGLCRDLPGDADGFATAALAAPADEHTLAGLIERIVDHDERALAALYDASFSRVYALVLRITQRAALAEEVVEDTFWQVWRQAPRFDATRGRALGWLMAMARSRAIDALRRDERFRHEALPEDDAGDTPAEAAPAPPDLLELTRSEHRLHQALATLDAQPRQLIALAFFRGLTHEEIAAHTALPLGTVKSQIRRALQSLKAQLGDDTAPTTTTSTR